MEWHSEHRVYDKGPLYSAVSIALAVLFVALSGAALGIVVNDVKESKKQQHPNNDSGPGSDKSREMVGLTTVCVSAAVLVIVSGIAFYLYGDNFTKLHVVVITVLMAIAALFLMVFGILLAVPTASPETIPPGLSYTLIGISILAIAILIGFSLDIMNSGSQRFTGAGPSQARENPDA